MDTLYILDAYALIYRCYFAFGSTPLTDSKGRNTAAFFGVFNTLYSFFQKYKPRAFVCAFDSRTKTFRHEMYGEYKANRAAAPDDLHAQVPWIEEALAALGAVCLRADGFEADDIIAAIVKKREEAGKESRILTGDKDLCALVNDKTHLLRPLKKGEWEEVDAEAVVAQWEVKPSQMTDLLALMGDASDNIPGVKGVGAKTAAKYLKMYGSLDGVLSHADEVKGVAGEKLRAGAQSARLSKQLVQLRYDVPNTECQIGEADEAASWNYSGCADVLEKYELKSLAAKWRGLSAMLKPLDAKKSIAPALDAGAYIPLDAAAGNLPQGTMLKEAIPVAAWLLESDKALKDAYTLGALSKEEGLSETDAEAAQKLWGIYSKRLEERSLMGLFMNLELPLMDVLREMERNGIHIDTAALADYSKDLKARIDTLEREIYALSGHEFNIGSPKQLSAVLYDEMRLVPAKKSTDAATLEELQADNPIVEKVLGWRELTKLRSTYVDTLPNLVDMESRVHTTFVQTGTATGRLSSRDPNLQNIPVRTEEGRRIRRAFTAPPGMALVSADYSQIELVVLASLSGEENMMEAFKSGVDIHRRTAQMIFGTDDITPEMRRAAKTINFGVIYGMSAFRLSRDLGISRTEAAEFIKKYFAAYPAIEVFKAKSIEMAMRQGFVTTIMGRQRYVRGLESGNRMEREAAGRICVNTRVQGSAADIMKKSMLDVHSALKASGMNARLLLQVHDELIIECGKDEAQKVSSLVKEKMEGAAALSVPLKVSVESGDNWGDFH